MQVKWSESLSATCNQIKVVYNYQQLHRVHMLYWQLFVTAVFSVYVQGLS